MCALGLLFHAQAPAAIIDDLTTGFQSVSVSPTSPFASSTVAAPGAMGGTRRLTSTLTSPTGNGNATVVPTGLAVGGTSSSGTMLFQMEWDGGGLGLGDLTSGGLTDCIALEFFSVDTGHLADAMQFQFEVTSLGLGTATLTRSVGNDFNPLEPLEFAFSDAAFSAGADGLVFGSVDSLKMTVAVDPAGDFAIHTIRTAAVPDGSPPANVPDGGSTGALLGSVLLMGGIARRLRARARA